MKPFFQVILALSVLIQADEHVAFEASTQCNALDIPNYNFFDDFCHETCKNASSGTPCKTRGISCDGKDCTCRALPQIFFRAESNVVLSEGNDVEGWEAGKRISRNSCRYECKIRVSCMAFIQHKCTGACYLKIHRALPKADNNQQTDFHTECKYWHRSRPEHESKFLYDPTFLDPVATEKIKKYIEEEMPLSTATSRGNSYWDRRVIYENSIYDPEIKVLVREATYRAISAVRVYYQPPVPLYPETVALTRWVPGMILGAHADNGYYPSSEANYTPDRSLSAILYLNSDFEGGTFYFQDGDGVQATFANRTNVPSKFLFNPSLNSSSLAEEEKRNKDPRQYIGPRPGLLIGFGAGPEYFHGVTRLHGGMRYTINMWFTDNLAKVDRGLLPRATRPENEKK